MMNTNILWWQEPRAQFSFSFLTWWSKWFPLWLVEFQSCTRQGPVEHIFGFTFCWTTIGSFVQTNREMNCQVFTSGNFPGYNLRTRTKFRLTIHGWAGDQEREFNPDFRDYVIPQNNLYQFFDQRAISNEILHALKLAWAGTIDRHACLLEYRMSGSLCRAIGSQIGLVAWPGTIV